VQSEKNSRVDQLAVERLRESRAQMKAELEEVVESLADEWVRNRATYADLACLVRNDYFDVAEFFPKADEMLSQVDADLRDIRDCTEDE
jgi:hypothetical protein